MTAPRAAPPGRATTLTPFAALLLERLAAVLREGQAVMRSGAPEAVHQMRVASRRLREGLALAAPDKKLRREVRRVTRALGSLREEQVTQTILGELATSAVGAEKQGFDYLLLEAAARIERHHRRMRKRLARVDLGKLGAGVRALVAAAGRRGPVAPAPLDALLPGARACDALLATVRERQSELALHRLRVAVKHLRYAVELVCGRKPAGLLFVERLKRLQEALGHHHDLWVAGGRAECVRSRLARIRSVALAAAVAAAAERLRKAERAALAQALRVLAQWPAGSFARRAGRLALPDSRRASIVLGTRALGVGSRR